MSKDEFVVPEQVSVSEMRADLRRILETAYYFGRRYVIMRNGDAVAVLVGLEDFRKLVGAASAPADVDRR